MPQTEQKVTETTNEVLNQDGAVVREDTKTVQTSDGGKTAAVNGVWYVFGFVAIVLAFRFVLKLFGANPNNAFVDFVYSVSSLLSLPFDTIFGVEAAQAGEIQAVFEPSILVAIAVYALIAWGIAKLFTLNQK